MTQTGNELPCPYCGERRPHFSPGGYCVRILKERLEEAEGNLANERDMRRREPGLDTMIALFNAASRSAGEANARYETCHKLLVELQSAYRQKLKMVSDIGWQGLQDHQDAAVSQLQDGLLEVVKGLAGIIMAVEANATAAGVIKARQQVDNAALA